MFSVLRIDHRNVFTAPRPAQSPSRTNTRKARTDRRCRRVGWEVQAHDGIDLIGRGRHERMVVRSDQFDEKLRGKIPS